MPGKSPGMTSFDAVTIKEKNPAAWAGFQTQGAIDSAPGRSDQLQTSTRRKRQP
jgi:hypothetical protein